MRILKSCFLFAVTGMVVFALSAAAKPEKTQPVAAKIKFLSPQELQKQLESDLERVQYPRDTTYQRFTLFRALDRKWETRPTDYYFPMLTAICGELSSRDWGNSLPVGQKLLRQLSEKGVERSAKVSLQWNLMFLLFTNEQLPPDKNPPSILEQEKKRKKRATQWLSALSQVQKLAAIDLKTLPLPFLNVSVPDNSLPAGIEPEAVSDPKVRAQYKAAIAKNSALAQRHREVGNAKRWKATYWPMAKGYFTTAYSNSPRDKAELEALLKQFPMGEAWEKQVLGKLGATSSFVAPTSPSPKP